MTGDTKFRGMWVIIKVGIFNQVKKLKSVTKGNPSKKSIIAKDILKLKNMWLQIPILKWVNKDHEK